MEQSNRESQTITTEPIDSTPIQNVNSPAGYKEYQDTTVSISIFIPENWGEGREPGDIICDLNIRPTGTHTADMIQQWQANPNTTIISENEFVLRSSLTGQRFVIDSMGRAAVFITEINQRVVILTCFGDFTLVDKIAVTLNASE